MSEFSILEYRASGCFQFEEPVLAVAIYRHTNGWMCPGCPKYDGGNCASLRKMKQAIAPKVKVPQQVVETVREEAERRGLTIKEIRRQRAARTGSQY